jgi:GTP-binding protein
MVPAITDDVKKEYDILLNELKKYNPELLDKDRILAITKCDLVDDDRIKEIKKHLPKKVPHVFISSVANQGINELKDLIWLTLNKGDAEEDW